MMNYALNTSPMIPKSMLSIENLKWKIIEDIKQLEKEKFAVKCFKQTMNYYVINKDVKCSEVAKVAGNKLYGVRDLNFTQLYKVLSHYNESIAYAPLKSELMATAYANKTAVLLRMRRYDECIIEAEKALRITELMSLKIKLMCRKAECLTALGSTESRGCLEKARFYFTKSEDESEETRDKMEKLIEKTQAIVDGQKLDIPKENKRRTQAIKMVEEVEKMNFWKWITTGYSEKYGRHLVTARDFEPGDIIAVEKPYFNHLHDSRVYQYCYHCFNHLWTVVPCDHCHWRLFCSEKCKTDAWNEYHELDCALVCHLRLLYEQEWADRAFIPFLAGIFCKIFREAGSIKQILAVSESMSKIRDSKGFSSDAKFKTYQSIFTVPVADVAEDEYGETIRNSVLTLIGIAKYTKILSKNYDFKEMKKLSKDGNAVLLGALLLKLSIIINSTCPRATLVDEKEMCKDPRCECTPPINPSYTILMVHGICQCVPNCESVRTYNNKNIIFALQPIKAGSKLIIWERSNTVYDSMPRAKRQETFSRFYNCPCECEACNEDWLDYLNDSSRLEALIDQDMKSPVANKLWNERNFIATDWTMNSHKPGYPDIKIVNKTVNLVKETWNHFTMPSAMIIRALTLMFRVFTAFHNPCEIVSKIDLLRARQLSSMTPINTEEQLKQSIAKMKIFS